jgi:DNA topoisomerase IA
MIKHIRRKRCVNKWRLTSLNKYVNIFNHIYRTDFSRNWEEDLDPVNERTAGHDKITEFNTTRSQAYTLTLQKIIF